MENLFISIGILTIVVIILALPTYPSSKPIVMVCRVSGVGDMSRIGVVLFEDFVKSSKVFWKKMPQSATPKIERVSVSPSFVFRTDDFKALEVLLKGCCVQEAVFNVNYGPLDQLAAAYEYVHKKSFDFQLLQSK